MEFASLKEFDKDLARLLRKYRSLNDDLELLKKYLRVIPGDNPPIVFRIPGLGLKTEIYKVKRFRCKALKKGSRSGIRVIYAYFPDIPKIIFSEMYYHEKDDTNCDNDRLRRYFD